MAVYKVHIWQEQYATAKIEIPDDIEPGSNEAKDIVDKYLDEHASDADEGVNVHESTGWFVNDYKDEPWEIVSQSIDC